jgi:hypothetical protein
VREELGGEYFNADFAASIIRGYVSQRPPSEQNPEAQSGIRLGEFSAFMKFLIEATDDEHLGENAVLEREFKPNENHNRGETTQNTVGAAEDV